MGMITRRLPNDCEACSVAINMIAAMRRNNSIDISQNQFNYLLERCRQRNYDAVFTFLEDEKYRDIKTAIGMYRKSEQIFDDFNIDNTRYSMNLSRLYKKEE